MYCKNCTGPIEAGIKSCPYCGKSQRKPIGKTVVSALIVLAILGLGYVAAGFVKTFINNRLFIGEFMALAKESEENNRTFFKDAEKLSKVSNATRESVTAGYATLLQVRISDIKKTAEKAKVLDAPSVQATTLRNAFVELLMETVNLNEKVLEAALIGNMDRVIEIEAGNERRIKPALEEYFAKMRAAGIPVADNAVEDALSKINSKSR